MRYMKLLVLAVTLAGCNHSEVPVQRDAHINTSRVEVGEIPVDDSLLNLTKWVVYNGRFDERIEFVDDADTMTTTFGEVDYRLDTVRFAGDTTIIILSPFFHDRELGRDVIDRGYGIGLGFISKTSMPFFIVNDRVGTQLYPQPPYNDLGDLPNKAQIQKYLQTMGSKVDPWFRKEAERRVTK